MQRQVSRNGTELVNAPNFDVVAPRAAIATGVRRPFPVRNSSYAVRRLPLGNAKEGEFFADKDAKAGLDAKAGKHEGKGQGCKESHRSEDAQPSVPRGDGR